MERIPYQQGQQGALEFTLRAFKDMLDFVHGLTLSKQPIEIDTLVIKKLSDRPIDLDIAAIFRRYNIFEFKSPTDDLTINQYSDLMTYVHRFQSKENVKLDEITGTLFRSSYPRELFREVKRLGCGVAERAQGVYDLTGMSVVPVQVIVGNELPGSYAALRVVSNRAKEEDIKRLLSEAIGLTDQKDLDNFDAALRISILANKGLFDQMMEEDKNMSEELERLLQPVIDRAVEKGIEKRVQKSNLAMLVEFIKKGYISVNQAAEGVHMTVEEFEQKSGLVAG